MSAVASQVLELQPDARVLTSRWPQHEPDEIAAVVEVLSSGRVNGLVHGEQTRAFEAEFARFIGVDHAVAVANGTVALELALRALGIGPGDEVIVPARSFFATASCVVAVGAEPVFADIDPVSHNICPVSVAAMVSPRTRAIICVHLAGWPCDMAALLDLCRKEGLLLIEDCAQAHGAAIDGQRVGSFGHAAAFSFCTDKIMSTGGEGGMVVTPHEEVRHRVWSYKDHGKSHAKVSAPNGAGSGFRYIHDSFGSNFRLTEMQAAIGRCQLNKLPAWLAQRRANAELLNILLQDDERLIVPAPPANISHAWYKYNLGIDRGAGKNSGVEKIVGRLRDMGITCASGSCPDMSGEAAFAGRPARKDHDLPNAARVGQRNLMLAVDHLLDEEAMFHIAAAVRKAVS